MKEYVGAILLVVTLLSIGARLILDRRFSSVTRLLFSLILLSALALPLADALKSLTLEEIPLPEPPPEY